MTSLRGCVYKNCGNCINLKDRKADDVKLFSFPKNSERRQKWIELGRVSPNIPSRKYFFCSNHFDRKYMGINSRRTVLVGEAVPFPYEETQIDKPYEDANDNVDFYIYEINGDKGTEKQDLLGSQDIYVESTIARSEMQDNLHDELSSNLDEQELDEYVIITDCETNNQESTNAYASKRKLDSATIIQTDAGSSKVKLLKTSPLRKSFERTTTKSPQPMSDIKSTPGPNRISSKETTEDEIDRDQFVDAQHVVTFIHKGEVYIQMPKEHYINEKIEMTQKLRKMERTLKAIKVHIDDLNV